jgi:hypothetical protein
MLFSRCDSKPTQPRAGTIRHHVSTAVIGDVDRDEITDAAGPQADQCHEVSTGDSRQHHAAEVDLAPGQRVHDLDTTHHPLGLYLADTNCGVMTQARTDGGRDDATAGSPSVGALVGVGDVGRRRDSGSSVDRHCDGSGCGNERVHGRVADAGSRQPDRSRCDGTPWRLGRRSCSTSAGSHPFRPQPPLWC